MEEINIKKLNLRFINLLRDYENKNITFDDVSKFFTYEELINMLENSIMSDKLTYILKNMDLPDDFQDLVNESFASKIKEGIFDEYLSLVSDHIILENLLRPEDEFSEYVLTLLKTDEARINALTLRNVRRDSGRVMILLENMEDDNLKLKYIHLADKYDFYTILSSIKDEKIQEIAIQKYPSYSSYLVSNLKNEEMRIYYYEKNFKKLDSHGKKIIFDTFSKENQEKYLERYWKYFLEEEKIHHLSVLKNEEVILQRAKMLNSDFSRIRLIRNLDEENTNLIHAIEKTINYDKSKRLVKKITQEGMSSVISRLNIEKLFSRHSDREKMKFVDDYSVRLEVSLSILSTMKKSKNVEKIINHYDALPTYDKKYNGLIENYAKKYNLDSEHLIQTVKIFGFEILKNITSDNLKKIINLDDVSFKKIMQLFDVDKHKMDNATLNDNVNIFLQRKFKLQNPEIINISSDIRLGIQTGQTEEVLGLINKIISEYDINNILSKYNYTSEQFIKELLDKKESEEKITSCLLEMTNGYIVHKRNEFIQKNITGCYQMFSGKRLDAKEALNFVVENYPTSMIKSGLFNPKMVTEERKFETEEIEFVNHPTALENIINFRRNPSQYQTIPEDVKKYMPVFNKMFEENFHNRININMTGVDIKKVYFPIEFIHQDRLINALLTLDPDLLKKGILDDSKVYQELSSALEKYKLFGFNDTMIDEFSKVDLDTSGYNIGNLINYFPTIFKELSEKRANGEIKNITLPTLLDIAECYSSNSDKLSILFGKDNARLLSSNPGPNSASMGKERRLTKAEECLKIMCERKTVSIPSFDKDFDLSNGKKMNVVVGNVSEPINLTYGERTGACMRIGGHADSLFNFCLKNENGFHIRFSNPENDNFVSRVSGFRNGNTVFLNELRFSQDVQYTNEDVKESCVLVAQALIDKSKKSSFPIENVVIAPEYVMESSNKTSLNVSNIKKGLGVFYTDIRGDYATVLATTDPDNVFVPIKLGNNGVEKYQTQRGKIRMYTGEQSYDKLSRIEMLDQILSGTTIEDTVINPKEDITFAYCGDDWYVTINSQGVLNEYMMKNSNKKEQAMTEKNECIQRITNQLGFNVNVNKEQTGQNLGGAKK